MPLNPSRPDWTRTDVQFPFTSSVPLTSDANPSLCVCVSVRPSAEEDQVSSLLPVNTSQQEYCITGEGDVLLAGDSWKPNACTSCTCTNGTVECFSQRCPAARCRVPVLRKGQCCPHCLGEWPVAGWGLLNMTRFVCM